MVTTVIIPAVKRMKSKEERMNTFETIEGRFAIQAKITTLITALSGFYMMYAMDIWDRYIDIRFWWIHVMTIIWILFTVVLFILEPLFLHKLSKEQAIKNLDKTYKIMHRAHWFLLILSIITIIGAVAGSHGLYFIK